MKFVPVLIFAIILLFGGCYPKTDIASPPIFDPDPSQGPFNNSVMVEISTYGDAQIYYTLNGTEPSKESFRYVDELYLPVDAYIRAVAIDNKDRWTQETTAEYHIMRDSFNSDEFIEAEDGFISYPLKWSPGGSLMYLSSNQDNNGFASYKFDLEKGDYRLMFRVMTPEPSNNHNSFYLSFDNPEIVGKEEFAVNVAPQEDFGWQNVSIQGKRSTQLTKGIHYLYVYVREQDTRLDAINLVKLPS